MVFAVNPGNQTMYDAFWNNTINYRPSVSIQPTASTKAPPLGGDGPSLATVATATLFQNGSAEVTTYSSFPGSAAPTAFFPSDHLVLVGGSDQVSFIPTNISVQPGDTITFRFTQNNHSVIQSSFSSPCVPLSKTSTTGQIGFNSQL